MGRATAQAYFHRRAAQAESKEGRRCFASPRHCGGMEARLVPVASHSVARSAAWTAEAMLLDLQAAQASCRLLESRCSRQERQVEQLQHDLQQARAAANDKSTQLLVEVEGRQLSEGRQRVNAQQHADTMLQRSTQWTHTEEQLRHEANEWRDKHNLVLSMMQAHQVAMSKAAAEMEADLMAEIEALKDDYAELERELQHETSSFVDQEHTMSLKMAKMRKGAAQREASMIDKLERMKKKAASRELVLQRGATIEITSLRSQIARQDKVLRPWKASQPSAAKPRSKRPPKAQSPVSTRPSSARSVMRNTDCRSLTR